MNLNGIMQQALNAARNNPNIANNPRNQELLNVLQSGDREKINQVGRNLCQSYGLTEDQAREQVRSIFGI